MRKLTGIFADPSIELSVVRLKIARTAARRAARQSRGSFRTARGQYRRYRRTAGETYLDWPRWHAEYLREYRRGGPGSGSGGGSSSTGSEADTRWFGATSGGDYTIGMP
ncbi:MAG: hypothetical protein JWN03_7553 [Nocardia sp.]|uniref:hypothetical protein n=1 Tax=Nocardia sp. TaxID=1821 RepID=UPI00260EA2F8|nr:hypothetical protein [Nocardia sp.]MCU1647278.1 hypothetical protein [Nocardia sp.]